MTIQTQILQKLTQAFSPSHLEVLNESHAHSVPKDSETHFKVVLVADAMVAKRPVQRHQAVYGVLADEFKQGLHALALHTYSPDEWAQAQVPDSPACLGGSKHDKKD